MNKPVLCNSTRDIRWAAYLVIIAAATCSSCGGSSSSSPPQVIDTFSLSIDGAPTVQYTEAEDPSIPFGYSTLISGGYNSTRRAGPIDDAVVVPRSYLNLGVDYDLNWARYSLMLGLWVEGNSEKSYTLGIDAEGIYYDTSLPYVDSGGGGTITIDRYDAVTGRIKGSYDITLCRIFSVACDPPDQINLSGSFDITREPNIVFESQGTMGAPLDLGVQPYISNPVYEDGHMVADNESSFYQISVTAGGNYSITLLNVTSNVDLAVYDNAGFNTDRCPSIPTGKTGESCDVTPSGDKLYFRAIENDTGVEGAWYEIQVTAAGGLVAEGSDVAPIDVTGKLPHHGQVGLAESYYMVSVVPDTLYNIKLSDLSGLAELFVYSDSGFTTEVCANQRPPLEDLNCNYTTGPAENNLYIKVRSNASFADGAVYDLNVTEFTGPLYYIETFGNGSGGAGCTLIQIYEGDGATIYEHTSDTDPAYAPLDCGADPYGKATAPFLSGNTYYIKVADGSISGTNEYYSIRISDAGFGGSSGGTPADPDAFEPGDDAAVGATPLVLDTVSDHSLPANDSNSILLNDVDWFVFTVP